MRKLIIAAAAVVAVPGATLAQEAPTSEPPPRAVPMQIAAIGNPPPKPPVRPLVRAPDIAPPAMEVPPPPTPPAALSAEDRAEDAVAQEPLLDLTATPD